MHRATGSAVPLPFSSTLTVTRPPTNAKHFIECRNALAHSLRRARATPRYDALKTSPRAVRGALERVVVDHHELIVDAVHVEFDRIDADL